MAAAVPSIGRANRVARAAAPEADLTRALFERYANQIFRYCLHQLGTREEAEDAVQSTFLNAFRGIRRGVVPEQESAWLFKIAHNVCLSRRRSTWRRGKVESPADFDLVEEFTPAPARRTEELMGFQDVLADMPETQRRAILLREWQGLSYREIAEELELSRAAVETLIFRARRTLAQGLEEPPAPKRKRLARAADLGNILAGVKSAFLGGGAAVKVAATVAVVSGSTVVATAPVQHHRLHAPKPSRDAPTPASPAPTSRASKAPAAEAPAGGLRPKAASHRTQGPAARKHQRRLHAQPRVAALRAAAPDATTVGPGPAVEAPVSAPAGPREQSPPPPGQPEQQAPPAPAPAAPAPVETKQDTKPVETTPSRESQGQTPERAESQDGRGRETSQLRLPEPVAVAARLRPLPAPTTPTETPADSTSATTTTTTTVTTPSVPATPVAGQVQSSVNSPSRVAAVPNPQIAVSPTLSDPRNLGERPART